jgi:lysine 2,3-aminomutase
VILPERIDDDFISLLRDKSKHFTQLSIGIHSNHIEEFDNEVEVAIKKIHSTDCQLLSQTVLLKGINDDEKVLTELFHQFIALKIRPYYLHHPDQVKGGMHFYLPIAEGRRIYSRLRKNLPGWAIPHYVLDIPGGEGKVQIFNPESLHFQGSLLNKSGQFIQLTEPVLH